MLSAATGEARMRALFRIHSRASLRRLAVGALCLLLPLGGCTMAPTYHRPEAPIPSAYPASGTLGGTSQAVEATAQKSPDLVPWKEFFTDPALRRVIDTALINNRDLRIAMLNIELTRAQYRVQRADLLPTIDATGQSSSQRLPADLAPLGERTISRQYSATLGFSAFELDLFGRIRSLTDQALETYYSVENDARTAQLSLVAETAGVYLQLVADRELYDITVRTYESRKAQYDLVQNKLSAGVASDLEVQQARGVMEDARSNMARYATRVGQDENYLVLLMSGPMPKDMPDIRRLQDVERLSDVPEGLPSELLERRPDIQAAEHLLKGYNANIGAARANFFPRITLTGALGSLTGEYNDLFASGQHTWSFLPQITLPIFDTGRNISLLQAAQRQRDIAVAQYEKAIQSAFREVGDSLVQRAHIGEQLDADTNMVDAAQRGYDLASKRYDVGVDSYLNVLDAERTLYGAQQAYVGTLLLRESNALTLYKALGGGWR